MTVQESGLAGQSVPDVDVLNFATSHGRILVTLNRRHFVRLHEIGMKHAGIIACTADNNFLALADRIDQAMTAHASFDGCLIRVHR